MITDNIKIHKNECINMSKKNKRQLYLIEINTIRYISYNKKFTSSTTIESITKKKSLSE